MVTKHKVITASTAEEFEAKLNDIAANFNIFATQTHIINNDKFIEPYVAVMFYKE